jgi:hypothetical protein
LKAKTEQRLTYPVLTSLFLVIFLAIRPRLSLTWLDFSLLSLATLRMGRLIAFDKAFSTYRQPFTKTVKHESGEGLTVEPKGTGAQRVIGELISCPICAGTWVSGAFIYGLYLLPNVTRGFMVIMAGIGLAEILNALIEALQWTGEAQREKA